MWSVIDKLIGFVLSLFYDKQRDRDQVEKEVKKSLRVSMAESSDAADLQQEYEELKKRAKDDDSTY